MDASIKANKIVKRVENLGTLLKQQVRSLRADAILPGPARARMSRDYGL